MQIICGMIRLGILKVLRDTLRNLKEIDSQMWKVNGGMKIFKSNLIQKNQYNNWCNYKNKENFRKYKIAKNETNKMVSEAKYEAYDNFYCN